VLAGRYDLGVYGAGRSARLGGAVVLGSSYGGLDALKTVLPALPASFPLPVVVVHHRYVAVPDSLPAILRAHCPMPVDLIESGYELTAGRIAVAPTAGFARISATGAVEIDDPDGAESKAGAVDRVLRAVAQRYLSRSVAAIMTGRLSDGALGVRAVKRAGGFVVVQDPSDAVADGMPIAALASGCVDHRVPLRLIGPTLVAVTMAPGALDLLRVPAAPWAAAPAAV
jgi:two-component system, chemotaxis family, protein-glutamate methylesterase/glutaminase